MPLPITEFMVKFQELKRVVKSKPETIGWKSRELESLAELVYEVWDIDREIARTFELQSEKFTTHVEPRFVPTYKEYLDRYQEAVSKAASPIKQAKDKELLEALENLGEEKLQQVADEIGLDFEAPEDFDVDNDDPVQCINELMNWIPDLVDSYEDGYLRNMLNKGLGAYGYLQNTVGIDHSEIMRRWVEIPHTLIPRHVSNHHGQEVGSLYNLLAEAHKAYVVGCNGAAMALCRAILDMVLTEHYRVEGKDLEAIITKAEGSYRHIVSGKGLHEHRKTANLVLHDPKRLKELTSEQVANFLNTLSELIERVPDKK